MRWPSILTWWGGWSRQPHGDLIALEFGDPAYPGPAQAEDFWLFNAATGRFRHLPGWIDDGRLVLLLQGGGRTVVAIELPAGSGALGGFVPIVA